SEDIRLAIRPNTALISVMHVNNEFGTVQPIEEIAALAHERGILFHSDGVQAPGRIAVDLKELKPDLYTVSGHKLYAPKGVGALIARKKLTLEPMLAGGRHEAGRRAGTENVPGAVAMGAAAQWLSGNRAEEALRLAELRNWLERTICDSVPDVEINGTEPRVPNTTNVRVKGIEGEALVIALDLRGFAVSSGAACSSGAVEPSPALLAIGLSREEAKSSIRISLGRSNTREQVEQLAHAFRESVEHLRRLSPVYRRTVVSV
ncbi:MAG TPA: cysteine desulfurase family protein, partial [Bryobacteraceae bacterium]|nr:cysteine desulfurase family protein [Bryobacteraceae bacterium]